MTGRKVKRRNSKIQHMRRYGANTTRLSRKMHKKMETWNIGALAPMSDRGTVVKREQIYG
ncbi:hypothetical protein BEN30_04230 [Magnetovibrio blakemorei]|uniref:Uncharacterized protein n=1 Tax=Magnetovibrio blakemorei TaxID=28181 RepID=A0A1E5QC85_9PROT|nr:hypothetical protein BEN30_04230 [Magnetovibrio blakemorei]